MRPDAVILATGAQFSPTGRSGNVDRDIPGAGLPHVCTPEDILLGKRRPTGKVVVLDAEGTHASAGIAELLTAQGAEVVMVSSNYAPYSNRLLFAFEGIGLARRMAEAGVAFVSAKWASEITSRSVALYDVNGGPGSELSDVDAIVLATGRISRDHLAGELEGKVDQLFVIGDALGVRPWATAAYEGQKFARLIGAPDAPSTVGQAFFRSDDPTIYPVPAGS
jgi:dimethylamine/trimethylamine dehydrogenase